MTKTPSAKLRSKWLEALLPIVPFEGWTDEAADQAAEDASLSHEEQVLAAPNGVMDLLQHFFDGAEDKLRETLETEDLSEMGVRGSVAFGVRTWLNALEPHREPVRKAVTRGFLPWRALPAAQRTWSIADTIWDGIGDTSTDYNKYTKRGLLASAIPPIVLKWCDEENEDLMDEYILKRLTQVMKAGQTGAKVFKPVLDVLQKGWDGARRGRES